MALLAAEPIFADERESWENFRNRIHQGERIDALTVVKNFGIPDMKLDRVQVQNIPGNHTILYYELDGKVYGKNNVISLLIVQGFVRNYGFGRFPDLTARP